VSYDLGSERDANIANEGKFWQEILAQNFGNSKKKVRAETRQYFSDGLAKPESLAKRGLHAATLDLFIRKDLTACGLVVINKFEDESIFHTHFRSYLHRFC
jgi:hypothetical protein